MKQVVLDVNIIVDLCVERAGSANSNLAIAIAKTSGLTLWGYVGSVQTMEYVVASELFRGSEEQGLPITRALSRDMARKLLARHMVNFQWLAALSGEGNVFDSDDPEDEQIIRALDRFPSESAIILTRDKLMLKKADQQAATPEDFIKSSKQGISKPIAFIDLKTQQDQLRPQLERSIHTVLHHGKKSCNLSRIGCTSFFPSKPLGCYGDGGAIFTPDTELAEKLRQIRIHGQKVKHQHPLVGINGRLDTMQAAILLAKLERFAWEVQRRHEIGTRYTELINSALSTQYWLLSLSRVTVRSMPSTPSWRRIATPWRSLCANKAFPPWLTTPPRSIYRARLPT